MAVPGYSDIAVPAVGDCADPEVVNTSLDNITSLYNLIRGDENDVTCQSPRGKVEAVEAEMTCVEIEPQISELDAASSNSLLIDKKLILLDFRADLRVQSIGSANGEPPSPLVQYEIRCGDEVLYTSTYREGGSFSKWVFADCPRGESLYVCARVARIGGSQAPSETQAFGNVYFCGAILCIGKLTRTFNGYMIPPVVSADCQVRRESLYMLAQNANTLCKYLKSGKGRTAKRLALTINEEDSQTIANNLPDDTIYLITGEIEICYRSLSYETDGYITVNPIAQCLAEPNESCLYHFIDVPRVPTEGDSVGETKCVKIPVDVCGKCNSGDDLVVGFRSEIECNNEAITQTSEFYAEIVSVKQTWCVWVFERQDAAVLPDPIAFRMQKCIPSTLIDIYKKIKSLHDYLCEIKPVNATCRNPRNPPVSLISEAQTLIPPIPSPVPLKAWNLSYSIIPRWVGGYRPGRDVKITYTAEIKCGDTVIDSQTDVFYPSQVIDGSRKFKTRGNPLQFQQCVECAIDEDLTVEVSYEIDGDAPLYTGDVIDYPEYQIDAFCF